MSFTGNATCNVFKTSLFTGAVNFTANTYRIALYTNTASFDQNTTAYAATGEVVASGYVAGGSILTPTVAALDGTSFVSFDNVSWSAAFTARGALIYKAGDNGAVCVLDFGADRTSTSTFTVQFPPATNTSAVIRLN